MATTNVKTTISAPPPTEATKPKPKPTGSHRAGSELTKTVK